MSDRERGESGQFVESVTLDDVLEVFNQVDGPPVITSSDVADQLNCTGEAARQKLTRLSDRGEVARRKTGRTTLWWLTEGDEDDEPSVPEQPTPAEPESDTRMLAEPATTHSGDEDAERRIRELDRPGEGEDYELRVNALLEMYTHLQENPGERLSKSDFEEALEGIDVGYLGGFDSLWSNWISKNTNEGRPENALDILPGVEKRGDEYVYTPGGGR